LDKEANPINWKPVPLGDSAILIQLGTEVGEHIYQNVQLVFQCLQESPFTGMVDCVLSYTTLTVFYDPYVVWQNQSVYEQVKWDSPYERVIHDLQERLNKSHLQRRCEGKVVQIPVCYGGDFGPDLQEVASATGLTPDEVIAIHAGVRYLVYMIGFAPGFPYLGGMSEQIAVGRKLSPRVAIPAGSVGIAGTQTGIYPIETPGGWQLIGKTPRPLFRPNASQPSLLQPGDRVQFVPITPDEFQVWQEGKSDAN
jgi:inhibitor of KinA